MNPRDRRLLKCLVEMDRVFVRDLRALIGALNPAQNALSLRKAGWNIKTEKASMRDRDGKLCYPGFYWIGPGEKAKALEFLQRADRAAGTAPSVNDNPELHNYDSSDKANNNTGGNNDNLLS